MVERGTARGDGVEGPGPRPKRPSPARVDVAEQHQSARDRREDGPQPLSVDEAVPQPRQADPVVDRGMVHEDHRRAPGHLGVGEDLLERCELAHADASARDERGPRDGARQRDDRGGPAQLDAGERTLRQVARERGQVAAQERAEVVQEPPLRLHGGQIDVVVSRHGRDLDGASDAVEDGARLLELALEREVGDVAGHDELIGLRRRSPEHRLEVVAPEHAAALPEEVRVTGDALVEEHPPPLEPVRREHVQVGDVGDADWH